MSSNQGRNSEAVQRQLAVFKKKSLDVKFDLENTEYTPIENIGIGAYGVVCSAVHKKTKDRVAIKKIPRIFDCEKISTTTYREIKILKHFKHDNIISIRDILKPRESMEDFRDIYVVFDLMESDLHKIIYSKQVLSEEHVRYFLYQLLRGLKYIHSANVIHRDLKPSNLLVNEDCLLRIGDFGMARGLSSTPDERNHFMTQYVATRWYRAPEIMLALVEYGTAVDMWSVGCIFAEMLGRKHLFPGRDYISQIKLIVGVLGSPSDALLDMCQSDIIKKFITKLGKKESIAWPTLFPKASRKAINVISKMLVLNPEQRMTVDEALKHPYLSKYHDPDDEPICVPTFNFDFENEEMNRDKLRKLIFKEITEYQEPRTSTLSFSAFLKPVPKDGSCSIKSEESATQGLTSLTTNIQGLQVVPNQETEGFKKPLEVKKEEPELTINKLPVPSTDIEMLSARSEDGNKTAPVLKKSIETSQKKDTKKGETISSDTKALVKAALLNSSLKKQRSESLGDGDDRPKPVTAAQRQKERENKRKKKKEKAIERMKKSKEKQGSQSKKEFLTDEDRELLQRWSKMQKANQPIAPKPESNKDSVKEAVNATVTSISDTGQTPGQQCLQQYLANQLQKKQNKKAQNQDISEVTQNIGSSNLVLQKGQGNSDNSRFENVQCDQVQASQSNVSGNHGANVRIDEQNVMDGLRNQTEPEQSNMNLSTINFESLKMLGLVSSQNSNSNFQSGAFFSRQQSLPFSTTNNDTLIPDENQNMAISQDFRVVSHGSPGSQQGSPQKEYSNHSSPESYQSAGSPEYYQPGEQGRLSVTETTDHHQRSPQSLFDQQTNSPQSVYENQGASPQPPVYQSQGSPQGAQYNQYEHQRRSSDEHSQQNFGQFDRRQSGEGTSHSQSSQQEYINFERRTSDEQLPNQAAQSTMISLDTVQDLGQHISQMPYAPVLLNSDQTGFQGQFFSQSNGNEIPFKPHGILHNAELSGHDPTLFSQDVRFSRVSAAAGSSDQLSFQANTPPDLIASLSRQLSKQQVEDPGPPALALTPRGTGAGYGVGMDLDALMMDAQEVTHTRPEPSPLSSSLLTDWMEVTGDLNIDIDALEQELSLQSPMTLSYNDLSMYPS